MIRLLDFAAMPHPKTAKSVGQSVEEDVDHVSWPSPGTKPDTTRRFTAEGTDSDPYSYWYDASADRCTLVKIPKWQNFDVENDGTDPPIGDTHGMHYFQRNPHDLSRNTWKISLTK